jgi:hypothetical protein
MARVRELEIKINCQIISIQSYYLKVLQQYFLIRKITIINKLER